MLNRENKMKEGDVVADFMDDDLEQELRMEQRRRMIYNNEDDEDEEIDERRFLDA